jgi:hypothetical protein
MPNVSPDPQKLAALIEGGTGNYVDDGDVEAVETLDALARCLREATVIAGGPYYLGALPDEYGPPRLVIPLDKWETA